MVGIPKDIVSALRSTSPPTSRTSWARCCSPCEKGGPLRRSGFNHPHALGGRGQEMGMPGLHFHDLRHTGNMLAAELGAGLKDLMARMGHDNVRAAMIYQHAGTRCGQGDHGRDRQAIGEAERRRRR